MTLREDILSLVCERYATQPEYLFAKDPDTAVLRHPNKKWYGVIMKLPRSKLGLQSQEPVDILNVKCGPVLSGSLRLQPGIFPGYHMNKGNWITVLLDGTVDPEQIEVLLDLSYNIVEKKSKKKTRPEI